MKSKVLQEFIEGVEADLRTEQQQDDVHDVDEVIANIVDPKSELRTAVHELDEYLGSSHKLVKKIFETGKCLVPHLSSSEGNHAEVLQKFGNSIRLGFHDGEEVPGAIISFGNMCKNISDMKVELKEKTSEILHLPLLSGDHPQEIKSSFDKCVKSFEAQREKGTKKHLDMRSSEGDVTKFGAKLEVRKRELQLGACHYLQKSLVMRKKREVEFTENLLQLYEAQLRFFQRGVDELTEMMPDMENYRMEVAHRKIAIDGELERLDTLETDLKRSLDECEQLLKGVVEGETGGGGLRKKGGKLLKKIAKKEEASITEGATETTASSQPKSHRAPPPNKPPPGHRPSVVKKPKPVPQNKPAPASRPLVGQQPSATPTDDDVPYTVADKNLPPPPPPKVVDAADKGFLPPPPPKAASRPTATPRPAARARPTTETQTSETQCDAPAAAVAAATETDTHYVEPILRVNENVSAPRLRHPTLSRPKQKGKQPPSRQRVRTMSDAGQLRSSSTTDDAQQPQPKPRPRVRTIATTDMSRPKPKPQPRAAPRPRPRATESET